LLTVKDTGSGGAMLTFESKKQTTNVRARYNKDGSLVLAGNTACGAMSAYNMIANIVHGEPRSIGPTSTWIVSAVVQFSSCSSITVPLNVRVERADGDVLTLVATGHFGKAITYEGVPSRSDILIHAHAIFTRNQFTQFDATADEVFDGVPGHAVWILAVADAD